MSGIIRWEYRQEIYQGPELLNKWGADGWEVVCTVGRDGSFLILKRPILVKRRPAEGAAEPAGGSTGTTTEVDPAQRKKFKELI